MAPKKKQTDVVTSAKQAKSQAAVDRPRPVWPPFQPLLPGSDLHLEELVPQQIVTVSNLFSPKLCKDYVNFLRTLPLTTTPGKPKRGEAVRVNDRFQIDDAAFAERLWSETALKGLILGTNEEGKLPGSREETERLWGGEVVGLNPNIRIYRYSRGQYFDQHYDDSNSVTVPGAPPVSAKTTWTLLLYLTSPATGCTGGETVFYPEAAPSKKSKNSKDKAPEPVVVELEVGMALLHRHGAECMLHEGREVKDGEKWVIRSDLCVRR